MRRTTCTSLKAAVLAGSATLVLAACGGSGFDDEGSADPEAGSGETDGAQDGSEGSAELSVLIGSSGDAETDAVTAAASAWSAESGNTATVAVAADLPQELSQGFAAGSPPDLFYLSTDHLAGFATNGSLFPYGDQIANVDDFYPTLLDSFTYEDQLYCAPKDFSTLALVINTDAWADAGLTDDDIPGDWAELADVAAALTTGDQVGLTFGPEYQRIGVFMHQAGGGLLDDGGEPVANSPENVEAVTFVQQMLNDGVLAFPSQVDSGWGGEAFGSGRAAMTIEGNWIIGALANDYPHLPYQVVELPAGPAGQGTLQFTNCWGVPEDSPNRQAALDFVEFLTAPDQQMTFAENFGVMPSVEPAADRFRDTFPDQAAFLDSVEFATGLPTLAGFSDVVADFNGQIEGLASADVESMLESVQTNLQAITDAG